MKGEPDVGELYQKRYDEALAMLKELAEYKNRNDTYRGNRRRIAKKNAGKQKHVAFKQRIRGI